MRKIALGSTEYFTFTTRAFATGIPTALAGTPDVSVIEDNSGTPIDGGATVATGHASVTGLNLATIVATTGNGYEYGKKYTVYIDTGTVDSVSVVGEVVAEFVIETATEEAVRLLSEFMYPSSTLGASASHSTTVIDMTGALDANTKADGIKNEILAVHDATNDTVELVRCSALTATTLLATVAAIDDGGPMTFTPAAGDHVWRIGQATAVGITGGVLAVAGDEMDLVDAPNATAVTAIQSGLPTAAALATVDSNVDANKVVLDALTSAAAAKLALSAAGIISGAAVTGTLSTTVMTSDLTGYLDDELIGRTIIWTGGTADGQASDITDYASASGTVTYTAIPTAPANNDTFVIV